MTIEQLREEIKNLEEQQKETEDHLNDLEEQQKIAEKKLKELKKIKNTSNQRNTFWPATENFPICGYGYPYCSN